MKKLILSLAFFVNVGVAFGAAEQELTLGSTVLDYRDKRLGDDAVIRYTKTWQENGMLGKLMLSNNNITDKSIPAILELLKTSRTLHELVLGRNCITDVGAKMLAETIENCSNLLTFYIHDNTLTDKGYQYFVQALKRNKSLIMFNQGRGFANASKETVAAIGASLDLNKRIIKIREKAQRAAEERRNADNYILEKRSADILKDIENLSVKELQEAISLIEGYRLGQYEMDLSSYKAVEEKLIHACLKINTKESLLQAHRFFNEYAIAYIDSKDTVCELQTSIKKALDELNN